MPMWRLRLQPKLWPNLISKWSLAFADLELAIQFVIINNQANITNIIIAVLDATYKVQNTVTTGYESAVSTPNKQHMLGKKFRQTLNVTTGQKTILFIDFISEIGVILLDLFDLSAHILHGHLKPPARNRTQKKQIL